MKLIKAAESDSSRVKAFFERMVLPGAIDCTIQRPGSFFDQYRLISDDFETYLLLDEHGEIVGMASIIFREGFVLGEKQVWGYATDLRIAPTRKALTQWAQHFLPVLERARDERRCRHVFSAVQLSENPAYNALVRPTSHAKRRLPRYHLLNRFHLVNIHGRVPFSIKPIEGIRLKELDMNNVEALCAYLNEKSKHRPLAAVYQPEDFLKRIEAWAGLELSDFRIAQDVKGQIIGCSGLWNSSKVQSYIPQTYHGFAHTLHQLLTIAGWFGAVRPTAQPEKPMPMRFMTHLACDSPEVFHRLADDSFSRLGPKEFLSYAHFRRHWRTLPTRSFVTTAVPYGLYMILPPNAEVPLWPAPNLHTHTLPPEFEAAWI